MTLENSDLFYNETPSAGIQERDIDLLIVEELTSSIEFVHWFCNSVSGGDKSRLPGTLKDVDVKHSCLHIGDGYGESDIVLRIKDQEGGRHLYLIEDKIEATFMPNQAERYRKRLKTIIDTDRLDGGKTVLLAPQSFLDSRSSVGEFDSQISYERIFEFFDKQSATTKIPELTNRYSYRRDFIQRAIDKKKYSGLVLNPDPRICDFREEYAKIVTTIAPELKLGPLSKVKDPNQWFNFPAALTDSMHPGRFLLIHKPYNQDGRVVIQVTVDEAYKDKTIAKFNELLVSEPGMHIDSKLASKSKSFAITIKTPGLDMRKPISEQMYAVDLAIKNLTRLLNWFNQNRSLLLAMI